MSHHAGKGGAREVVVVVHLLVPKVGTDALHFNAIFVDSQIMTRMMSNLDPAIRIVQINIYGGWNTHNLEKLSLIYTQSVLVTMFGYFS